MSTLTTTTHTHRARRLAVLGLVAGILAAGSTAIVVSVGDNPSPPQSVRATASTQPAPAAQLRQYMGNHGEPRPAGQAPQQQSEQSTYEPQTPGQRP